MSDQYVSPKTDAAADAETDKGRMAGQLTHDWVGEDFLPSQLVQAVGQSFGLTSLVWFALKHLQPSEVFTFRAMLQTGRLFGAELGAAFVQTFVRMREQTYSNLIGLHINTGSLLPDRPATGRLCASRRWPLGRPTRGGGARNCSPRANGAEASLRARIH